MTVFISVRVDQRNDVPVYIVGYVAFGDVFYQFSDHVQSIGWSNPFPSVDSSIGNDDWFVGVVSSGR